MDNNGSELLCAQEMAHAREGTPRYTMMTWVLHSKDGGAQNVVQLAGGGEAAHHQR